MMPTATVLAAAAGSSASSAGGGGPALDNQTLLRGLEVLAVALVWLFFLRVMRAVWVEVRPPKKSNRGTDQSADTTTNDGRSQKAQKLKLRVIEPQDRRGLVYEIPDEVTVGRAAGCGVRVADSYTSNLHARLYRRDRTLWVEDLGSTNGTWVNAERIAAPARLGKGDLLQVGGTVFEVVR